VNTTLEKFDYPQSEIKHFQYWSVLLRPQQVTLGSLVLIERSDATAFSELSDGAMAELPDVIRGIEACLEEAFAYDKINYLMLMMVDPHVHFHVIPRYSSHRNYLEMEFEDSFWPKPVNLGEDLGLSSEQMRHLGCFLTKKWPKTLKSS